MRLFIEESEIVNHRVSIVINTKYSDEVPGGKFINKRIFKELNRLVDDLSNRIVRYCHYVDDSTPQLFIEVDMEWLREDEMYIIIDESGDEWGRLCYWEMNNYFGGYYGEDVAILLSVPQSFYDIFTDKLRVLCKEGSICFNENDEVVTSVPSKKGFFKIFSK